MASVVFLRAVNVGGHQKFQPSVLARDLADLGVVNLGAAGTFVVRTSIRPAELRAEILRHLPFKPGLTIISAKQVLDLVRSEPFGTRPAAGGLRRFVTVMEKAPRTLRPLPLEQPAGDRWEVRVLEARGQFALGVWRRLGRGILYPNAVIEKRFGVAATTRGWDTFCRIAKLLES